MRYLYFFLVVVVTCFSCENNPAEKCMPEPENKTKVSVTFEHFEDSLANFSSKEQLVDLFTRQPLIRDYVFRRTQHPNAPVNA